MDDLVIGLLEKYGGWAVVAAVVLWLGAEFVLDIVKELIMDKIKAGRINQNLDEWGSQDDDPE